MDMLKDVQEYAQQLVASGFTFEEFAAQWPNLADSEYGTTLKAEMYKVSV